VKTWKKFIKEAKYVSPTDPDKAYKMLTLAAQFVRIFSGGNDNISSLGYNIAAEMIVQEC